MSPTQSNQVPNLTLHRHRHQAQYFTEDLGNGVGLDMILIPGDRFIMGAPETEEGSTDAEHPQHTVTVPTFLLGKYAVTQAQWRVIAELPQVNRLLEPDPSRFKGDNRPVEQVSWWEAVEFCDRLSEFTNRPYRLPSEAEWEYACRAGTSTPFHVGETITTDLANYRGTDWKISGKTYSGFYGGGPRGIYRQETTPVGSFPPNAFGLYDMHGNVWEWCADHWHKNYEGAPVDGSVWIDDGDSSYRVLRGGSWDSYPEDCRSACRDWYGPDYTFNVIGFRVVCSAARTL